MSSIKDQIVIKWSEPEYRKYFDDDSEPRNVYKVKITYNGKTITLPFGDSIHNTENGTKTSDESYLENLCMDASYTKENYPTFADFANEFGYDEDSMKAFKIYNNALKFGAKIGTVFTDEEIQQLQEELEE